VSFSATGATTSPMNKPKVHGSFRFIIQRRNSYFFLAVRLATRTDPVDVEHGETAILARLEDCSIAADSETEPTPQGSAER